MTRGESKARQVSKKPHRIDAGAVPHRCGWFFPAVAELRQKFKRNCAAELAYRSGRSISMAERWLSKKCAPEGEALHALLNSDIGDIVFLALTADCKQPWAKALRRSHEISQLRDQQRETAKRLEALERDAS